MIRHGFYQMIHSVNCVKQWAESLSYSSQLQSLPLDGVLLPCFLKKSLLVSVIFNLPFTERVFHCNRVHDRSERNSDMNGDFWSRLRVLRPMRCVSVVHSLMSVDYCWCRHVWNESIFFFSACLFVAFCLFSKSILKCFCGRPRAGVSLQDFPFSNAYKCLYSMKQISAHTKVLLCSRNVHMSIFTVVC